MSSVRIVSRCGVGALALVVLVGVASAEKKVEVPSYYGPQPATEAIDLTMYARIREEGFKHSHVMQFAGALTEGIGPRLTGSPNMAKANAWTRDTLTTSVSRTRTLRTGASSAWDGSRSIPGPHGLARSRTAVGGGLALVASD